METAKSWLKENSTLVGFLVAQVVAIGAAAAAILAYSVKLETRVHIMETRGAEYTVARLAKLEERITILERASADYKIRLDRMTEQFLKDMQQKR